MTPSQKEEILLKIEERIEHIKDKMVLISEQRMVGLLEWSEYEKKREVLAKGRTALELEKKLLTEENEC